jgi:hypothetical protein
LLRQQPTIELARLYLEVQQETFASWVLWGSEHLASPSPEQRETVIDAIVLQDTIGQYNGRESLSTATAGGYLDEAPLFWSRARREHLNRLSPEELAAECRKMLEIQAERVALHNDIVSQVRSDASRRMAALVRSRYSYKPSLIEAARYFRQQKISLKRASTLLVEKPLECIDGSLVTFRDDRFIERRRDQVLGAVTEGQFRRVYWSLGKIPPTP